MFVNSDFYVKIAIDKRLSIMFSDLFAIYRLLIWKRKTGLVDFPEVICLQFEITDW